jgi:hypothetical protein
MFDIALITCAEMPQLHPEDALLRGALSDRGIGNTPVVWGGEPDPKFHGWLMRTAWDYTSQPAAFRAWLACLPAPRTWNSPALMAWNMHKRYLLDLAEWGAAVVPTELFPQGSQEFPSPRTGRWVAKPAISAGSRGAVEGPWDIVGPHLADLTNSQDALLQPYYEGVETYRERSFVFVEGRFLHGVTRTIALLEGRGVDQLHDRVEPSEAEMAASLKVLACLDEVPLYARVDLIPDPEGRPKLLELEVIEPQLFLLEAPETAVALAEALRLRLEQSPRLL